MLCQAIVEGLAISWFADDGCTQYSKNIFSYGFEIVKLKSSPGSAAVFTLVTSRCSLGNDWGLVFEDRRIYFLSITSLASLPALSADRSLVRASNTNQPWEAPVFCKYSSPSLVVVNVFDHITFSSFHCK